jgi:hypothetical protein
VQGDGPCVLLEVHAPALIGDPGFTDTAVALLRSEETETDIVKVGSVWPARFDQAEIEQRVMDAWAGPGGRDGG